MVKAKQIVNEVVKEVAYPTARRLSAVVPSVRYALVKAADLAGEEFYLLSGFSMQSKFGARAVFEVMVPAWGGEIRTLMLSLDPYRESILGALTDGPLGPVMLEQRPTNFGNPYWRISDAEGGDFKATLGNAAAFFADEEAALDE